MEDRELYNKIRSLSNDWESLGCYVEGHYDMEQFKKVATDWLKTECEWETKEQFKRARKGYYKVVPRKGTDFGIFVFSENKMRGSKPIMEMMYL